MCGFVTRRSAEKKDDDDTITSKYIVCSRSGFNESKKCKFVRRRTLSSRCGCEAKIVLKLVANQIYRISFFVEVHNHDLVPRARRQFMRSNREMSYTSRSFMFNSAKVNVGASQSFALVKE